MERVCMYLRKSRADVEAEARGEGETLAKHKKALMKTARALNLNIVRIREEIVSGESLIHRPEMIELLKEVEAGQYDAVLVMDMDRLGRGDMIDQGTIQRAFKSSKTKIITPRKTYDLEDEFDEEYSEFESFMARKELKIINRRLQGGRVRSVEEGNYIGTRPPYGYSTHKTDKGERYLIPHPEQAPVVKMIFDMYTHEDPNKRLGSSKISNELNKLGYKTYSGQLWKSSSVLTIIKNAVYTGRIQWKKKKQVKSKTPGKLRDSHTRPVDEWIDVKGKHEPLIDDETFQKAQELLKDKYHVPYQLENGITNPLAGLIRCEMCGASMVYRPYMTQAAHLMCYNRFCENKSSRFEYVEDKLVMALEHLLEALKAEWAKHKPSDRTSDSAVEVKRNAVLSLEREMKELENQKLKLHDFLERGIYDEDTYLERSKILAARIEETKTGIIHADKQLKLEMKKEKAQKDIIPKVQNVIKTYHKTKDPAKKNQLLKSILLYATYHKLKTQRLDEFSLILHPKWDKR